ncbi:hypothetical protein GXP67_32035 [Rhodocytophaga rosea]|uniref:Uncharacterized protein n=1 Tax=Rhodocytophaga rosea TaxID=2704465 RepID=A0A6C0GXN1_9BACT|nr:hypothetical protein [Rhodocytophaga rosea]QHT72242.1 hypothetical protein GXP67_32035 [Rhodocytophaga rosea]
MTLTSFNLKTYQIIEPINGEILSKYKYLEGHPKQYRFDAKEGKFNINGSVKLTDTFTFQPVAWRIFEDDIMQMGRKKWAEIFFIDDKNCLSAMMFHGWSVENLFKLIEPLYYDDLTLADVIITATARKKENTKITPKGVYYIAEFSYAGADQALTKELKEFASDHKIYRAETLTEVADIKVAHNFYNPLLNALPDNAA